MGGASLEYGDEEPGITAVVVRREDDVAGKYGGPLLNTCVVDVGDEHGGDAQGFGKQLEPCDPIFWIVVCGNFTVWRG